MRIVKTKVARRTEILTAAKNVFLEKGFEKTTMEDVIAQTTLSKGGFYHYYSSTAEMLHDLMVEGIVYRVGIMEASVERCESWDDALLSRLLVDKMLDETDLMQLYVMFLKAGQHEPSLRSLFMELKEENIRMLEERFGPLEAQLLRTLFSDLMIAFMNSIIIGAEILNAREIFRKHHALLCEVVQKILEIERKEAGE